MHFVLFLLKSHCITSPHFNVNAGLRKNASLTVGFSCHIYRIKAEPLFEHKDREARWWQTFEHKWIAMLSSVLWWWRTKQSSFCTDGVERETDILSLLQKKETAQKRNSEWIKQQVGLKGDEFLFKMANTPRWNKITSDWASTAVTADSIQSDWHALHRRPRQVIVMSSDSNSPRLYRWYTKDNASNNPWLAEQTMGNLYLFIQVKTNPCGHSIHRTHFKVIDSGRGGDLPSETRVLHMCTHSHDIHSVHQAAIQTKGIRQPSKILMYRLQPTSPMSLPMIFSFMPSIDIKR